MASYWLGGTPPRNTNASVPRLTPDRRVRTITSSGPGSGSVTGRISPQPGALSQNACASPFTVTVLRMVNSDSFRTVPRTYRAAPS